MRGTLCGLFSGLHRSLVTLYLLACDIFALFFFITIIALRDLDRLTPSQLLLLIGVSASIFVQATGVGLLAILIGDLGAGVSRG